jgi:transposase
MEAIIMSLQNGENKFFEFVLDFPGMQITHVTLEKKAFHVYCESIFDETYCPLTLMKCNRIKRSRTRIIRDLPISGKRVYLHLKTRQFYSPFSEGYFYESFSFVEHHQHQTIRYQEHIYNSCKDSGLQRVCIQEDLCWDTVETIFEKQAEKALKARENTLLQMLGIDEFAIKKGHKDFACVLVDLETGSVIDVLPYRDKDNLIKYFEAKGLSFCQAVQVFSCDMWDGYVAVAKKMFPQAEIVIDRFHFFGQMNKALDNVRKQMRRQFPDNEDLKGIKWLLLKNPDKLTVEQKQKLDLVLNQFPILKTAYEMKNRLRDIFESDIDRKEAETQIDQWSTEAEKMKNRCINTFLNTLKNWKNYVLNYFNDRVSNGLVEGINNKIKLIKRMAFGFRNFENFRLRIIVNFD